MDFIDWLNDSAGVAVLGKTEPIVDGRDTRQWRLKFTETVEDRSRSDLPLFANVEEACRDAADELFSTATKRTPLKGKRVEMDLSFQVGDPHAAPSTHKVYKIADLSVEIRSATFTANPSARVAVTTVWLHGVSVEHAEALVRAQDRAVHLTVRALAPAAFVIAGNPEDAEPGQLVAGRSNGEPVCGRMIKADTAGHPVIDNFGAICTLDDDATNLSLWLESVDDLDVDDHVRDYADKVRSLGGLPTWADILTAATGLWAKNKITRPTRGTLFLNAAVMGVATERHRSPTRPAIAVAE